MTENLLQDFKDEVISTMTIEIDEALKTTIPTGWHELSMGWFIAKGVNVKQAVKLADQIYDYLTK